MSKQIPILFSTAMVQATLEDRKTMTRRVMKSEKVDLFVRNLKFGYTALTPKDHISVRGYFKYEDVERYGESFIKHKYGNVGDVLWVRETFRIINHSGYGSKYFYKADACSKDLSDKEIKWKPSLFMPKDACRIFLEITKVKVERLHDISEDEAIKEGVLLYERGTHYLDYMKQKHGLTQFIYACRTAKESFQTLWTLINGFRDEPYAWFKNPWVWVIEFKRIDKPTV